MINDREKNKVWNKGKTRRRKKYEKNEEGENGRERKREEEK